MFQFEVLTRRSIAALAVAAAVCALPACGDSEDGSTTGASRDAKPTERETRPDARDDRAAGDRADGPATGSPDEPDDQRGSDSAGGGGDDEGQVSAVVERMYRDLAAGDADGVCGAMSSAARKQIALQVPGGSGDRPADRTCVASLSKFLDAAAQSGLLERTLGASVRAVRVDGDVATVTVSFTGAEAQGGATSGNVRLEKENGSWRFGAGAVAPGR